MGFSVLGVCVSIKAIAIAKHLKKNTKIQKHTIIKQTKNVTKSPKKVHHTTLSLSIWYSQFYNNQS